MVLAANGGKSPLEELSFDKFKGKTYPQETSLQILSLMTRALKNDPNRLAWVITNIQGGTCLLSFYPTADSSQAFTLPPNGTVISMNYEEDGEAVGYAVYLFSFGAAANVHILEILRE